MFREDHVVRLIEQAAAAAERALGLAQQNQHRQALAEIDRALQFVWGLGSGMIGHMSPPDLIRLSRGQSPGETLDAGKLVALAELLRAEGQVYAAQEMTVWSTERSLKALELLLEVAFLTDESNWPDLAARVQAMADTLGDSELPPETEARLGYFLEIVEAR